jgi:2-keto-4-pentenoate hydratase
MTPVSHTLTFLRRTPEKGVFVLEQTGGRADAQIATIAKRFVTARRTGEPLGAFPGPLPADLAAAYACQDAAIALWTNDGTDEVAGWKVGLIGRELAARFHQDRLAGPIFRKTVIRAVLGRPTPFPVFVGGFAAVEAELLLLLGADAPADKVDWTLTEARELVAAVHVGIETAGSPLATINDLGPCAIVADFGNNAGLIVGPALADWRGAPVEQWRCETFVGGKAVGRGHGGVPPGGPFESLRFLLGLSARRGRPLKAGDWISTGAITGVHEIAAGQSARVAFDGVVELTCRAEPFDGAKASAAEAVPRW